MKMKKMIVLLLTVALILIMGISCFAEGSSYKQNKHLYEEEEYNEAVKIMYADHLQMEGIVSDYKNPEKDIVVACKLSYICKNVYEELTQGEFFDDYLEELKCWTFITEDGDSVIAINKNGKYEELEWVKPYVGNQNFVIDFGKVEKAIEYIGTTISDEDVVVKLISMEELYVYRVVYIRYKGEQFFIPFSNNSDVTGLENGKMYTLNDMITYLEKLVKSQTSQIKQNGESLDLDYESAKKEVGKNSNAVEVIIVCTILGIAFLISLLIAVRKRKTIIKIAQISKKE